MGHRHSSISKCLSGLGLIGLLSGSVSAQIFDDPTNLKVLPEDISSQELSAVMRSFAFALDARCETCHVGEAGQPLSTFDFAADEKEGKAKAREMMQMVDAINKTYLAKLDIPESSRVEVTCMTCHRGQRKPLFTADALEIALDEGGLEKGVAKYKALREQYHGSHTYDFTESVLSDLARQRMAGGKANEAEGLLNLNLEYFPESFMTYFMLGELKRIQGDNESAKSNYEKALEINPNLPPALNRLKQLSENDS